MNRTSLVISDETLLTWILEAIKYPAFLETRSSYEQELIYYRAITFLGQIEEGYIRHLPTNTPEELDLHIEAFGKMRKETCYDKVLDLIRPLRPIVGYTVKEAQNLAILAPDEGKTDEKPGLSKRRRILIHCYEEGKPFKKGHRDYDDYITFATPRKRIGYPNGSQSKATWLIEDIEKILVMLSESARKQAESELNTLRANI